MKLTKKVSTGYLIIIVIFTISHISNNNAQNYNVTHLTMLLNIMASCINKNNHSTIKNPYGDNLIDARKFAMAKREQVRAASLKTLTERRDLSPKESEKIKPIMDAFKEWNDKYKDEANL